MSIKSTLLSVFQSKKFTMQEAYKACPNVNKNSVRARIYENLGTAFERLDKGVYIAREQECVVIEGNGRDLSMLKDSSIDCIIVDHPWEDKKANKGGNRNFAKYPTFQYTEEDFREKARVLKQGSFLCEILPAENESNFDYLYQIKKKAELAGFQYYAKVPWKKGTFVGNTGRKAKNTEDVMIFGKGKARALRADRQRGLDEQGNPTKCMSGTREMLPTCFDVQPVPKKELICEGEKPVELFEQLLSYVSLKDEIVLDQYAGSGAVGVACIRQKRKCILFEVLQERTSRILSRVKQEILLCNT